jgi:cation diffusion facilitator CzcD-associated flavoprotein CzcO
MGRGRLADVLGYPRQMPMLAVVGAGPKGIAIAAKARALAAAGLPAPRVVLVDRSEVAGNWSGRQGYTNGLLPLGTPPEKDVGYPYRWELERAPGIHQRSASLGHAAGEGRRLPVCRELGRCVR